VEDVLAQAARYGRFIKVAGGGFTVSGGEPLLQPRFTRHLLRGAKELGLSTALDTSGFLGARADDALLDATDLVLLDIKSFDPDIYRKVTGGREVEPTLAFARRLAERGTPVWVRFVLVPGLTDEPSNVEGLADFVAGLGNVGRLEVLPFHRLGEHKYTELDLDFPLGNTFPPSAELLHKVRKTFRRRGLFVS
jgi:pyruvate formate lyase activating enzyme